MTHAAEIKRRYRTRDEAWDSLASRGFSCATAGGRSGRWIATVDRGSVGVHVRAWLPDRVVA